MSSVDEPNLLYNSVYKDFCFNRSEKFLLQQVRKNTFFLQVTLRFPTERDFLSSRMKPLWDIINEKNCKNFHKIFTLGLQA